MRENGEKMKENGVKKWGGNGEKNEEKCGKWRKKWGKNERKELRENGEKKKGNAEKN